MDIKDDEQGVINMKIWKSPFVRNMSTDNNDNGTSLSVRSYITNRLWANAVVPYIIDNNFNYAERQRIMRAINYFHKVSCVRWVTPQRGTTSYVIFTRAASPPCRSMIGRFPPRPQNIFLHPVCMDHDTEHEMMHALGFIHEHSRLDRDCYITIRNDMLSNFNFHIFRTGRTSETWPYDYNSVMHYPAFFGGMGTVIWGKGPYYKQQRIGPVGKMTQLDIWQLNTLYCRKPHWCTKNQNLCTEMDNYERRCKRY